MMTTPTQLIEHEESELVPPWGLHPYILASLVQEGTQEATGIEV